MLIPPVVTITSYTDPYCTWCWGSEPMLTKLRVLYGSAVSLRFVMGGLVRDIEQFSDPGNGIGGTDWYRQVADHWRIAGQRHGMPVDANIWFDIKDEWRSTYPASIFAKAAEIVDPPKGARFLRRLREAASAERLAIHRADVAAVLAEEVGIDPTRLAAAVSDGRAEAAFAEDRKECRARGIHAFPTFSLKNSRAEELGLSGYSPFSTILRAIDRLSGKALPAPRVLHIETDLFEVIELNGSITAREAAEVFDMAASSAQDALEEVATCGLLTRTTAGSGTLYRPATAPTCAGSIC